MSTDRELLELAAKAARYLIQASLSGNSLISEPNRSMRIWSPLTDDGDALRLAVKLKLDVSINEQIQAAWMIGDLVHWVTEQLGDDLYHSTRRAIVRAAAEIGRAMQ